MVNLRLTYTQPQHEIFFENDDAKFKVIPKGRRFGFTRGAAHACIDWCLEGISPILWVDTINGNIERYYERYFQPILKQLPSGKWSWNQQKKVLKIYNSLIDFRSAEQPESIEGFGYKKIILNEAGIILRDNYLYSNAILPMMMDFSDSQLIAAGVPKGKIKKDGEKHKFYQLWENVIEKKVGYWGKSYTSYDNPLLTPDDINEIENEISLAEADQEIRGKFIDISGNNPFAHQYSKIKHESVEAVLRTDKSLIISIDFNINPFALTFHHKWEDLKGGHHHVVGEKAIDNGSVPAVIKYIKENYSPWLPSCKITGDASGKAREKSHEDLASFFIQIKRGLSLSESQIIVPPNPTHFRSRNDTNYVLLHYPDFKIHPTNCPETCRDMIRVQWDAQKESIMKTNRQDVAQRADFLDTIRNFVNTFHKPWIEQHSKKIIK